MEHTQFARRWVATGTRQRGDASSGLDEFAVIERLRARFEGAAARTPAGGEVWIGDDAAVVGARGTTPVLSTDLVVEGVHVDLATCTAGGRRLEVAVVAVSDLAAPWGARPA